MLAVMCHRARIPAAAEAATPAHQTPLELPLNSARRTQPSSTEHGVLGAFLSALDRQRQWHCLRDVCTGWEVSQLSTAGAGEQKSTQIDF